MERNIQPAGGSVIWTGYTGGNGSGICKKRAKRKTDTKTKTPAVFVLPGFCQHAFAAFGRGYDNFRSSAENEPDVSAEENAGRSQIGGIRSAGSNAL